MRILHVISSLAATGTARQLARLAAGMPRGDWEMRIVSLQGGGILQGPIEASGVPVNVVARRSFLDLFAWRKLRHEIGEFQPALIHTWDAAAQVLVGAATIAEPCRLVSQLSADESQPFVESFLSMRFRVRTARFVAPTLDARQTALDQGYAPSKVIAIPLGLDVDPSPAVSREEFVREFGLPENARCVAVVGRLLLRKRIKDLIWAADMLKFYGLEMHMLLFGEGPQRWRLDRYARQCQVDDRIHFLGERADVARCLPQCDLLWQADEAAGTGSAILEAMAAGIPVVASDIPAHRELVMPGVTGLLVRLGARADFAEAANRLIADRELAGRLGEAGRERVRAEFTTAKMVERFTKLYREVLGLRG